MAAATLLIEPPRLRRLASGEFAAWFAEDTHRDLVDAAEALIKLLDRGDADVGNAVARVREALRRARVTDELLHGELTIPELERRFGLVCSGCGVRRLAVDLGAQHHAPGATAACGLWLEPDANGGR